MASSQEINIPQQPPMVMIHRLISSSSGVTVTETDIRDDNVFFDGQALSEAGLIENMAQTAAAGSGARSGSPEKPAPVGFIGGIRNLKINDFPKAGETITTTVTVIHEVINASVTKAEVYLGDRLIATCELKIFLMNHE
jgi:predicted hotdog family 3-hydroxylacyl-ACP dehydratase